MAGGGENLADHAVAGGANGDVNVAFEGGAFDLFEADAGGFHDTFREFQFVIGVLHGADGADFVLQHFAGAGLAEFGGFDAGDRLFEVGVGGYFQVARNGENGRQLEEQLVLPYHAPRQGRRRGVAKRSGDGGVDD